MDAPFVSVVIDCYNHERFVEEAIHSVLSQEWGGGGHEILVVDDGSTDATRARVEKYAAQVRYIHQKNQGQAVALNTGFQESKGDILCFLDGDDVWFPGRISALLRAFAEHSEAGFVQSPMRPIDALGRVLGVPRTIPPEVFGLEDLLDGRDVLIGTSGLSIRRSIFEKLKPVPAVLRTCADEYVSKHALFFAPACTLQGVFGGLRLHESNSFQGADWRPEKIERFLSMAAVLDQGFEAGLRERGFSYTPRGRSALLLSRQTKEILLLGWRGERGRAVALWSELRRELPFSAFHAFKLMTLLIAVVSPSAYLGLHGLYARLSFLPAARSRLFSAG